MAELLDLSGAGGSPFTSAFPLKLDGLSAHTASMKVTGHKALKKAIAAYKQGKYMGANAWARRALHIGSPEVKKMAMQIIAATDEAGLKGLI